MPFRLLPSLLALLLFVPGALAAAELDQPRVHIVQPPAWIERAGSIVALRPGDPLLAGDIVRTGPNGRVQMDLPEGSRVKLGEQVQFRTARYAERADDSGGFFDAAFDVLKGAFRFTTGIAGRERRRDINFQVGAVTAGIRGTDIWGKSLDDGSSLVVLLEGKVQLDVPGQAPRMVEQPLHGVMLTSDGETRLIDNVPADKLEQYAQETESTDAVAMMREDGEWQLIVMSVRNERHAEALHAQLNRAGFPAEIVSVSLEDGEWQRVVLNNLVSAVDARKQGEALMNSHEISGYWLRRN